MNEKRGRRKEVRTWESGHANSLSVAGSLIRQPNIPVVLGKFVVHYIHIRIRQLGNKDFQLHNHNCILQRTQRRQALQPRPSPFPKHTTN